MWRGEWDLHLGRVLWAILLSGKPHRLVCCRCGLEGAAWRPPGQPFGRLPSPSPPRSVYQQAFNQGGARQEGTREPHKSYVFDRISPWLSLRAYFKCKKGNGGSMVSGVAGRRQSSDLIWTLGLSSVLFRAGASKPSAFPASGLRRAHTQSGHALFTRHRALGAARQSVCNIGPSFPRSPLLRIINKQDGSLYCCFAGAAGGIHSHNRKSCTRRKICSKRQHECH